MANSSPVHNALSFDLEHWYTATLVRESVETPTDRIENSVERVLEILEDYDVTATFFVVGKVAEAYPDLIARVADAGHELGTHGHTHTPLFELDEDSFRAELHDSVAAIKRAADVDVAGFRAPNFSVTPDTAWAFNVLSEQGLAYDSSVFPVRTPMYGVLGAPTYPYTVDMADPFSDTGSGGSLQELPVAVHPRYKLPVAGGFYARTLPKRVLEWGINALNARGHPAVLYFHPWEFNPEVKVPTLPLHTQFVSYYRISQTGDILRSLLKDYQFDSIANAIGSQRTGTVAKTNEPE